ncbi:hypothetical protein QMN71_23080, partial [Escherichia coli]|uniref:hypothetical protein n=1 Tax=Escherichia coli TaxID=562 RepID=UPI0024AE88AC
PLHLDPGTPQTHKQQMSQTGKIFYSVLSNLELNQELLLEKPQRSAVLQLIESQSIHVLEDSSINPPP